MILFIVGLISNIIFLILAISKFIPVYLYFYIWAWGSFILMLEGLNIMLYGESLMFPKFKKFIEFSLYSLFLWLIFEILNLRTKNWEYINVPMNSIIVLFGCLCYSTVLPAIYDIGRILEKFVGDKHINIKKGLNSFFIVSGIVMFILLLALPDIFFPLKWLVFIFLLEPFNNFEVLRNGKRLITLGVAGIICGVFWEFWNYFSGAHWRYTLPLDLGPKIFQMPLLGYFGFIPFGIEIYVMYLFFNQLVSRIRYKIPVYIFYSCFVVLSFYLIILKTVKV